MPHKQRHTAKRVFDRLRDECGFTGGCTIIKDYARERGKRPVKLSITHKFRPYGSAEGDIREAR